MERLGSDAERYLRDAVQGHPIWIRSELEEELRGHLVDAIDRQMQRGVDRQTAEREALAALGPASDLRDALANVPRRDSKRAGLFGALAALSMYIPFDVAVVFKIITGRPGGSFQRDYQLGRYDSIIARNELELRRYGPRFNLHHELGMAYNAIGDYESALQHLSSEVDWLKGHPLPRLFGGPRALATAYSNLSGVLDAMGRHDEADQAVAAGLDADPKHGMLHLQRARRRAAQGGIEGALSDIRALLEDQRMQPRAQLLVVVTQDPVFASVRDDPQFQRLILRAATP